MYALTKRLCLAAGLSITLVAGTHAAAADSAFSHFYPVTREAAQFLPAHTVFRPADLSSFGSRSLPVVFWANGGCNASNFGFTYLLTVMAARGFVVSANGAFDAVLAGGTVARSKLTDTFNWMEGANNSVSGQFAGRLDTSEMAVAGHALVSGLEPACPAFGIVVRHPQRRGGHSNACASGTPHHQLAGLLAQRQHDGWALLFRSRLRTVRPS
jgi:hypothetical protein